MVAAARGDPVAPGALGGAGLRRGLVCVWLEIGRPLRALHVFFQPLPPPGCRVRPLLLCCVLPMGLLAVPGLPGAHALAVLALAFCIAKAACCLPPGILPGVRVPSTLMLATGLTEGLLWMVLASVLSVRFTAALAVFMVLVVIRQVFWMRYHQAVEDHHGRTCA